VIARDREGRNLPRINTDNTDREWGRKAEVHANLG
jgi:hypothetical protein